MNDQLKIQPNFHSNQEVQRNAGNRKYDFNRLRYSSTLHNLPKIKYNLQPIKNNLILAEELKEKKRKEKSRMKKQNFKEGEKNQVYYTREKVEEYLPFININSSENNLRNSFQKSVTNIKINMLAKGEQKPRKHPLINLQQTVIKGNSLSLQNKTLRTFLDTKYRFQQGKGEKAKINSDLGEQLQRWQVEEEEMIFD